MNNKMRKVPIQNILYMFSYIWDKVEYLDTTLLDNNDDFNSVNILSKLYLDNVIYIMKKGIYREYKEIKEEIKGIKGKVNFKDSLNNMSFENAKAVCIYDELLEDNLINQIIKTTAYKLYKSQDIKEEYKKNLNNVLLYFNQVNIINITKKSFESLKFNKNNYYVYYMILICELINDSLMLSENKGKFKFINILDDEKRMQQIFELFVFKYYKKKQNKYNVSYQKKLNWNMFNGNQNIVPEMRLDIYLENEEESVIIDTKYYPNFLKNSYYSNDKRTLISGNLYQMYTYLNHLNSNKKTKGVLLYPYNSEAISEKYEVDIMNSNQINKSILQIQTIDLSQEWRKIEEELNIIIDTRRRLNYGEIKSTIYTEKTIIRKEE